MSFLPNLRHDIFISYAHIDNRPDLEGDKGWVEQFEEQLYTQLLKVTGKEVDIWRDPELKRGERFDPVIEKAVKGSAVMISLVTKRYIDAPFCQQELEWFCEKARNERVGLEVNDAPRVIPVVLYNLPYDSWPEVCQGTSGHLFHDVDDPRKDRDSLGRPLDPQSDAFSRQLRVLVDELCEALQQIRERAASESDRGEEGGERATYSVFLANAADDRLRDQRLIREELQREGIEVVSRPPPPWEAAEHERATLDALGRVDLAVHLLGDYPGKPLDEDSADFDKTYPIVQAELAAQHSGSQLVLLPRKFRLDDIEHDYESYREFMRGLLEKQRGDGQLEVVQTGWRNMIEQIKAKRKEKEDERRRQRERDPAAVGMVFIDLHVHDVANACDLVTFLTHRRYSPLMVPSAEVSPSSGMQLFEENLRKSELFIVVYGGVARNWVKERLNQAVKLVLSNDLPVQIGVYVAPPLKQPQDLNFRLVDAVMDNTTGFHPDTVESLLERAEHPG